MSKILPILAFVALFLLGAAAVNSCAAGVSGMMATPTLLPPTETPQQNIAGAAENLILQNMQYQMTRDAAQAQQENAAAQLTGTAVVKADFATQQADARDRAATQQAIAITATQQYLVMAATATQSAVEAEATERSWNATATLSVARNTQEAAQTQAFAPMYGTAEVAGLQAKVTEQLGSAELVKLTVDRQTMKNGLDAYLPWTLIVLAFVVGVLAIVVFSQYRQLKRDGNGLMHGEAIKHSLGTTIIRPDQIPGPGVTVTKAGQVLVHGNAESQADVTRRAQLREATLGKSIPEFKQVVGMFGAPSAKPILRVLSPGEAGSLRGDFDAQISAEVVDDD